MGGPGGHMFVLRASTQKLEPFGGLHGTEESTDVLLYKKSPYFLDAGFDIERLLNDTKKVWFVGLHPISKRRTYDDRYLIQHQCVYHIDRPQEN